MNRIMDYKRKLLLGLAAAVVLGGFAATPTVRSSGPAAPSSAPVIRLADGQETHGRHGAFPASIRLADGQETHGKTHGRQAA